MLISAGITTPVMALYAVTELAIRYRPPAKLDDVLTVVTRICTIRAASVDIHQTVRRGDVILTEADVTAALVAASGRPKRQPEHWLAAFRALLEDKGNTN